MHHWYDVVIVALGGALSGGVFVYSFSIPLRAYVNELESSIKNLVANVEKDAGPNALKSYVADVKANLSHLF